MLSPDNGLNFTGFWQHPDTRENKAQCGGPVTHLWVSVGMMLSHLLLGLSGVLLRCKAARHLERHLRGFEAHLGLEDPACTQHGQAIGLPAPRAVLSPVLFG